MARGIGAHESDDDVARTDYRRALRLAVAVAEIARDTVIRDAPPDEALRALTRRVAAALEVERVGVWLFDAERTAIESRVLFERTLGRFSSGTRLSAVDFPVYFAALKDADVVPASDARSDARTAEFRDSYLVPNDIHSMLDAPLVIDDALAGVICHEAQSAPRAWTQDEVHFAVFVAAVASNVLAREQKRAGETVTLDHHLARACEASKIAIVTRKLDTHTVRYANAAANRIAGGPLVGRSIADVLPPDVTPDETLAKTGVSPVLDRSVVRAVKRLDGRPLTLEITSNVFEDGPERFVVTLARDVSESELRFNATFTDAPVGIAHVAFDGSILRANKLFCQLLGVHETELKPYRGALDTAPPPEVDAPRGPTFEPLVRMGELGFDLARVRTALASGQTPFVFRQHVDAGVARSWLEMRLSFGLDAASAPTFFVCYVADVTAQKTAQESLHRIATGTAATGSDASAKLVEALALSLGAHATALFELPAELRGNARTLAMWRGERVVEVELPLAGTPLEVVLATGRCVMRSQVTARFPGNALVAGAEGYIGIRIDDTTGAPLGALAAIFDCEIDDVLGAEDIVRIFAARAAHDLTSARANEATHRRDPAVRQISNAMDDVVWVAEWPSDKPIFVGGAYETVFGRAPPSETGTLRERLDALHPDDRERVAEALAFCGERAVEATYRVLDSDGALRWVRERVAPVRGDGARPGGPVTRVTGTAIDVTRVRALEDALRAAEQRLVDARLADADLSPTELDPSGLVGLLGRSPAMRDVFNRIRLAAERDVTVLLTGETRNRQRARRPRAVHALSPRARSARSSR